MGQVMHNTWIYTQTQSIVWCQFGEYLFNSFTAATVAVAVAVVVAPNQNRPIVKMQSSNATTVLLIFHSLCRGVRHVHISTIIWQQRTQAVEIRRTQLFLCESVCVRACDDMWLWFLCCTFAIVQINVNILIGEMTFHCEKFNLHIIVVVSRRCWEWQFQSDLFVINFFQFSIKLTVYTVHTTQVAQGFWLKLSLCHWNFDHC